MTGVVSEPDFRDLQEAQTSFTHLPASSTSVLRLASPSATHVSMILLGLPVAVAVARLELAIVDTTPIGPRSPTRGRMA